MIDLDEQINQAPKDRDDKLDDLDLNFDHLEEIVHEDQKSIWPKENIRELLQNIFALTSPIVYIIMGIIFKYLKTFYDQMFMDQRMERAPFQVRFQDAQNVQNVQIED